MKKVLFLVLIGILSPWLSHSQDKLLDDNAVLSLVKSEIAPQFTKADKDILQIKVRDAHKSKQSNIVHYYFRQKQNGLEINGTESSIHYANGKVLKFNNRLAKGGAASTSKASLRPSINAIDAIRKAADYLGYSNASDLEVLEDARSVSQKKTFSKGNVSRRDIPIELVYHLSSQGELILAWDLSIYETRKEDWWSIRMDANSGEILEKQNWMLHCNFDHASSDHVCSSHTKKIASNEDYCADEVAEKSGSVSGGYRVYEMPVKHPADGSRTLVSDPDNALASPYGWHDIDGAPGAEYTTTRGNNVHVFDDGNNVGYSVDGGNELVFDFPLDTSQDPDLYEDAGQTNLFYWNNLAHDVLYQYGFDEASGNFQENNYGKGGNGSDYVNARSQAGLVCNATMGTPADGGNPSLTMFICSGNDGNYSNPIILHEYGHGLSTRLTGGPAASGCLSNAEQMGEGWSDYIGLIMTMDANDQATDPTPIGGWYLINDPNQSIRPYPYSTDMSINPHTYANSFSGTSQPHGIGSVWCNMLWEMTWGLIDQYGFDADIYTGTGGNNIAFQLVVEGMKLQPCSPGFVDGRDAILAADQALYGGANQCIIWEAFAKRGLGKNASQGSSDDRSDGTEAFNLPTSCGGTDCEIILAGATNLTTDFNALTNQIIDIESSGSWTATTTASWVTITNSSGTGNGQVVFDITENPDFTSRSATIEVTCETFTHTFNIVQGQQPCTQTYGSIPYSTGFESGAFGTNWCTQSSELSGRVIVTNTLTPRGSFHLSMDTEVAGPLNLNEARLGLDLSNAGNVGLTFWWKEFADETNAEDGVFISDDGGLSFSKIYALAEGTTTYEKVSLNLTQLAIDNGLSLTANFIVKFQQYDNLPAFQDGIAIDDITVYDIDCTVGTPCNDNDPCTINDVLLATCECGGTFQDSDSDGVCDVNDVCPGFDDNADFDGDDIPDGCDNNTSCSSCTTPINSFPHSETFEVDEGAVCQYPGDDFDWVRYSGTTTTAGTGPTAAHEGNFYFYIESSSPNFPDKTSGFQSTCYDLSSVGNVTVNFWAHMYGATMGTLNLEVTTDNGANWVNVWSLSGDQGTAWFNVDVDVSAYTGGTFSYRFIGTTASSNTSDFSLDLITVDIGGLNCTPGNSCDDNDACTINDVYDSNCACAGTFQDSDNDTVCDANDQCPGFDDLTDSNGDGIPDGCDCTIQTTTFPQNPLTHTGSGASNTTLTFSSTTQDVSFLISDLGSKTNGNQGQRYIDQVTVSYVDENGNTIQEGTYSGANQSSATIDLAGTVQSVTVSLTDGYDGNTSANMSIDLSDVTICAAACSDSDNDGVCDDVDQCPGFDDTQDADGDGIPDGCDNCDEVTDAFPTNPLTHIGSGSSSTTLTFTNNTDVSFTITELGAKVNGSPSSRYIDVVTVSYVDGSGNTTTLGTYSGQNQSSVPVSILGAVQSVTVSLSDDIPNGVEVAVNLSSVNSCGDASGSTNFQISNGNNQLPEKLLSVNARTEAAGSTIPMKFETIPNPFSDYVTVKLSFPGYETTDGELTILNTVGQVVSRQKLEWSEIQEIRLNTVNWTRGVYYLYYKDDLYHVTQKILKIN